ncbi:MAG: mechanosensitive ion channel domain-containing protein [Desulfobacterales bacterium]
MSIKPMLQFLKGGELWIWPGGILVGSVILGLIVHGVFYRVIEKIASKTRTVAVKSVILRSRKPTRVILVLIALILGVPNLPINSSLAGGVVRIVSLGLVAALAWAIISFTGVIEDIVTDRFPLDVRDNLNARQVHTRIRVLRRITVILIVGLAVSAILMSFTSLRRLGTSILASAGIAGIVVGMAARPTLSNLIAGVQVALTEPIRLDDVVIVEGEWGWIEEIRTTYVVVRIWDLRRLVLPLSYFIEKPFQNWTRVTADILGTVFIYADYTFPVEELRQELHRVLQTTDMWDGKVWGLQVTNATDRTIEMRALMSAADSGTAWNLRCYVREQLIGFMQKRHPEHLPKTRAEVQGVSLDRQDLTSPSVAKS